MVEEDKGLIIRFPEFGERVQWWANSLQLSIKDIQRATGVGYEMARRYFLGVSKPDDEGMRKLAALFGITPAMLDWGAPPAATVLTAAEPSRDEYLIRYYPDVRLSAGHGAINGDHKAPRQMPVPKWMLPPDADPSFIVIVPVKGTSMTGELEDGALACVDTREKTKFRNGKIYAYNDGEETMVKYFFTRVGGGILIKAKNEIEFPEQVVPPHDLDKIDVVGRVIAALNRYWQ